MKTGNHLIEGPVFAVMTPFHESGDIAFLTLAKYLGQIYMAGGRIFYVTAYSSRYSVLTWKEIKQLNTMVSKGLGDDATVIVGDPIHCSTQTSIEFAKCAKDDGADAISLIYGERFYSNQAIYNHYAEITDQVDIPIVLHVAPLVSGYNGQLVNWPIQVLNDLLELDNIVAIKLDSRDDKYIKQVIKTVDGQASIILSGGGKRQWLKHRTEAWLNGISMFEPELAVNFWKNDSAYRFKMINQIETPFFEKIVSKYGWQLSIKAAMEARGIMSRRERLPMLALDDAQYNDVVQLVNSLPIEKFI